MSVTEDDRPDAQGSEPESLYELVSRSAEKAPEAIALGAPGRKALTYGGLLQQTDRVIGAMRAWGIQPNDRVALVLPNGPEMAAAFIGVAAGAVCAPLNPAYRANEFEFYLSDLNARLLIALAGDDSAAREVAKQKGIPIVELAPIRSAEAGRFELGSATPAAPPTTAAPRHDDPALVLHTSGTTSRPKIVPLSHRNLLQSAQNIAATLQLSRDDRCLNIMPLFHIHGLVGAVLSSLHAGASIHCTPGLDIEHFFKWIAECRPTWYTAVPTMHQAVVSVAPRYRDVLSGHKLRFVRSSSAALPEKAMAQLEAVFDAPVIESYGMTEAAHQMTSNPLPPLPRKPGSVGIPAGPDVAIMDDTGALLPRGALGEVVIKGRNVTTGYENNAAANRSAFTDGWFRTGDQGRFDSDGYLFLTGRLKELINRGGEKIAPKEVDDVLLLHPAVAQAVAFSVPHPTLGEDVAAAVVLKAGATTSDEELRAFVASRLADFKVPRQIAVVKEIPKGATGKLQRIGLADKLAGVLAAQQHGSFVAPRDSIEEEVAAIWRGLLGVTEVGVRDSFYTLGGDSLLTVALVADVEKRLGAKISLEAFLKAPTIETIAHCVSGATGSLGSSAGVEERAVVRDSFLKGVRNRILQVVALYVPGYTSTRVWLHRMRGVRIGRNVSIGLSTIIETAYPELVSIGNNVTIGMRVLMIGHLRDLTSEARARTQQTIQIEDDAYIGPGVIILPNVTIGRGAVVSAGSVVSRSVPPKTLVRGNPAEPVAYCGVSLGGGVSYEEFVRHLTPIKQA